MLFEIIQLHRYVWVTDVFQLVQLGPQHYQREPPLLPGDADGHQRQQSQGHQERGPHHVVHHGEGRKAAQKTTPFHPCNTLNNPAFSLFQGILNPMQAFLNTLAFRGWTGFDVDLSLQGRGELAWESISTSVPNAGGHNPMVGSTLLYQSHVQEAKKNSMGNGRHHSDTISVFSEGNWAFSSSNSNDSPVYQGW